MQRLTVTSSSIRPVLNENETQIILQRHCNYDKSSGELLKDSIKEHKE